MAHNVTFPQLIIAMAIKQSLFKPKLKIKLSEEEKKRLSLPRREPRVGPTVHDKRVERMRKVRENLDMTAKQMAAALTEFDGIHTTPHSLQSYFQGNIRGEENISAFLKRLLALEAHAKEAKHGVETMQQKIERWMHAFNINTDPPAPKTRPPSPWRLLGKAVNVNHSLLFRWYQSNRLPRDQQVIDRIEKQILDRKKRK